MLHLGFTGTQRGMTMAQKAEIYALLLSFYPRPIHFHHGDCIGADADFHQIARNYEHCDGVTGHLPDNDSKRAFCTFDHECPPLAYLMRNRVIVLACHAMIATPGEDTEQIQSGTWSTIRYARKLRRPLVIIWPSGNRHAEGWPPVVQEAFF